jgi:hypothetical protein
VNIDPVHEDKGYQFIDTAERLLGPDRFGGAWIDRSSDPPIIGVGVVDPSQPDVDRIHRAAQEASWRVQLLAVRHSRDQLVGLLESLSGEPLPGDSWVRLGWDLRLNAVVAELRRWDEEAVCWIRERIPTDALILAISPGAGWFAAV